MTKSIPGSSTLRFSGCVRTSSCPRSSHHLTITGMAPIEALPIEIVHTIVAHVDTSDLPAVALVSHLFNVTATPEIYARVRYTEVLARKREKLMCPLELLSARSDLLACLRSLEFYDVPDFKGKNAPKYSEFVRVCLDVVKRAPALMSFTWGTPHDYDWYQWTIQLLRSTFRDGENNPPSLGTLIFKHLGPVEHISLHAASRGENRAFAEWATSGFSAPLISLDISGNDYLELSQLRRILDQTLNLKSLSIIRSQPIVPSQWLPLVHHLKLESLRLDMLNDPNIERLGTVFPTIPTLRHITFDVYPPKEDTEQQEDDSNEQLLLLILDSVKDCTLHSFTLRLSYLRTLSPSVVNALVATHARTLRRLHLFRIKVSAQLVASMIQHIPCLGDLGVEFQKILNDLDPIIETLPAARHLHTLTDTTLDKRTSPIPEWGSSIPVLSDPDAEKLLRAGPTLRYVVSVQLRSEWVKSYKWNEGETETVISRRRASVR